MTNSYQKDIKQKKGVAMKENCIHYIQCLNFGTAFCPCKFFVESRRGQIEVNQIDGIRNRSIK